MIKLGSVNIKDLRLGSKQVSKIYLGDKLIWSNKSWVVVKQGVIGYYYDYDWTFEVNKGEKIRVTLTRGDYFKADVINRKSSNNIKEYSSRNVWSYEATLYDINVMIYGSIGEVIVEIYR